MYAMTPTKTQARQKEIDTLAQSKEVKRYLKLVAEKFVEASEAKPQLTKEESIIENRLDILQEDINQTYNVEFYMKCERQPKQRGR